ncbi:hypothetical protein V8E53_012542 [Lactarius tabidus]
MITQERRHDTSTRSPRLPERGILQTSSSLGDPKPRPSRDALRINQSEQWRYYWYCQCRTAWQSATSKGDRGPVTTSYHPATIHLRRRDNATSTKEAPRLHQSSGGTSKNTIPPARGHSLDTHSGAEIRAETAELLTSMAEYMKTSTAKANKAYWLFEKISKLYRMQIQCHGHTAQKQIFVNVQKVVYLGWSVLVTRLQERLWDWQILSWNKART